MMMKRQHGPRGLLTLFAVSCLLFAGCAAELMDERDVEQSDSIADESDDPMGEGGEGEGEGEAIEDEDVDGETAAGSPEAGAACLSYGQRCTSTSACCSGLVCANDGYIRYCRH